MVRPTNILYRVVHVILLLSIAVLFALPYVNKIMIVTVYEALQPITSVFANIFFLSDLFGQTSPNLYAMKAYATMAYILMLALHANFLLAIRRELISASAITEDIQLSWNAYLCRSFYSRLSPAFSMHCASSVLHPKHSVELTYVSDRVPLTRGMSHRDALRTFLNVRGPSLKGEYLTAIFILFLFMVLYWVFLDQKPDRLGSLFNYGVTIAVVYAQIYLITEITLLAIAYFAPHKKEKIR